MANDDDNTRQQAREVLRTLKAKGLSDGDTTSVGMQRAVPKVGNHGAAHASRMADSHPARPPMAAHGMAPYASGDMDGGDRAAELFTSCMTNRMRAMDLGHGSLPSSSRPTPFAEAAMRRSYLDVKERQPTPWRRRTEEEKAEDEAD